MFLDSRDVPAGAIVEADLCIVGAGAAGITIAREFASASGGHRRVVVLEGGGQDFETESQALYDGAEAGRAYPNLTLGRLRYFGGTTNHWAGWCLPLDEIDFAARAQPGTTGWPFPRTALEPFYRRAHPICQIGPYDYTPAFWGVPVAKTPAPFTGPHFITKILQTSPPTRFATVYGDELRQAPDLHVYLNANALGFALEESGRAVRDLPVATLAGNRFTVRSRIFILAAGGIENARMLLLSGPPEGPGIGNDHDLVGRHFMSHMEYSSGVIAVSDPYANFDFNFDFGAFTANARPFASFVGLSEATMRERGLPNIRIRWEHQFAPVLQTVAASRRLLGGGAEGGVKFNDVLSVVRDIDGLAEAALRKALLGQGLPVTGLILRCHSEQLANPDSRVLLGAERDALGLRRVVLDWRLSEADKRGVNAIHRLLGMEIGRAGFGRLRYALTDDDTSWPGDLLGNAHQMGTTRMHADPRQGVVDENCRLHGVDNLFVAGSSVFPSSGAANPTLTIVALALRLADHVKQVLA